MSFQNTVLKLRNLVAAGKSDEAWDTVTPLGPADSMSNHVFALGRNGVSAAVRPDKSVVFDIEGESFRIKDGTTTPVDITTQGAKALHKRAEDAFWKEEKEMAKLFGDED